MTIRRLLAALGLLANVPALAAETGSTWLVGLQGEVDQEGSVGLASDATWFASDLTQLYAGASYADSAASLAGTSTRGFNLGAYHSFGRVAVDLSLDGWTDPDLVTARSVKAALDIRSGHWTVSLTGQVRRSNFEPFAADALVTLRSGEQVQVRANADCDLDNTGLGLRVSYSGERWHGYLRGMDYQYDDVSCRFDSPLLDRLRRTRPNVFRQFARRLADPLSSSATTRIGAENALLDRNLGAGVGYDTGRLDYSLDYLHQQEFFDSRKSGTLSGTVAWRLGLSTELSLTAGVTVNDDAGDSATRDIPDSIWFGGLGLRVFF